MALMSARLGLLLSIFFIGVPVASALDFEREIAKQQRSVTVNYKRPPKSMAHFLHQYAQCKSYYGTARTRCNVGEAKRHYNAYKVAWEDKQRRDVAMQTGDFQISLERKDKPEPGDF